jgi:hypothetical protein
MLMRRVMGFEYVGAREVDGIAAQAVRLLLECGHVQHRKRCRAVPKRAICRECKRSYRGSRR